VNIFERAFLVAMWPLAKAIEFVGGAIDDINWHFENHDD
jgi:hypothetical protein